MKLSIECLQCSALDLKDYLEAKAEENPLLELEINPVFYKGDFDFNQISDENHSIQYEISTQLRLRNIEIEAALLETLVNLIDNSGYLHYTADELVKITGYPLKKVKQHLMWIKECEPIGVGSFDLKECLLLQMKELYPDDFITIQIILEDLEAIAEHNISLLTKKYHCSEDMIQNSIHRIRSLNPRPAMNYSNEKVIFIKPDIFLYEQDEKLVFTCVDYYQLKVHDLLNQGNQQDKTLNQKFQEGLFLLESLQKRKETLHKIMQEMLKVQQESLLSKTSLNPLRLIDIAKNLNLHETTISRAIKDKYFEYNGHIYPMKSLLNKQVNGASVSEVKLRLIELIADENHEKPYSDAKLQLMLKKEGLDVAIRTINKYREDLGIKNRTIRRREYGS